MKKLFCTILSLFLLAGCGGGSKPASTSTSSSVDWSKYSDDNKSTYNVIVEKMANHYCDKEITYPNFLSSDWIYADYDDQDDGKVMVSAPIYINGQKYNLISVISFDGTNMKGYYLTIGDHLYVDDGSCSEAMAKIGLPTAAPSEK